MAAQGIQKEIPSLDYYVKAKTNNFPRSYLVECEFSFGAALLLAKRNQL